jgi:AcrR family transcriptional regulator
MRKINQVRRRAQRRVSKRDWLQTALRMLQTGGIEAVRVERLAAELEVNKSGFYYHFRDRADLHAALLDYWLELDAAPIAQAYDDPDVGPAEMLRIIAEVVDHEDLSRYDSAIRQWARQDPRVRRVWRTEMNRRLEIVRGLFAALGFTGDDLEMRTRVFIAYHVVERDLFSDLSKGERIKLRDDRLQMLLGSAN